MEADMVINRCGNIDKVADFTNVIISYFIMHKTSQNPTLFITFPFMKSILFSAGIFLSLLSFSQTTSDPLAHARQLKDSGELQQAMIEVNKFIRKDSTVADYYDLKAEIYRLLQMPDEAMANYDKAISLNPKDFYLYHHRADLYYTLQNPDKAIEDNEKVLSLVTTDTLKYDFIMNRGSYYTMKRDFQKAYDDFYSVLQFDSTHQGALTNIAAALGELKRSDEALQYLQKVVRLYPDFVGGYGNLAFEYMERGEYKKALEYNNRVLELDGNEPLAYNNRSYVKYKLNDLKGAMEDVNHSLKLYPENSYAYKNRALIFIALKQFSLACDDLHRAIALGFTEMYGDEVQKLLDKNCTRNN
jgi:tetratricopeptide (TPR) repeat protein